MGEIPFGTIVLTICKQFPLHFSFGSCYSGSISHMPQTCTVCAHTAMYYLVSVKRYGQLLRTLKEHQERVFFLEMELAIRPSLVDSHDDETRGRRRGELGDGHGGNGSGGLGDGGDGGQD